MASINITKDSNIIVTGSNGQLGLAFYEKMKFLNNAHFLDKKNLDITNKKNISDVFKQYNPDIVINTAAYTNVDKAESEREQALLINAKSLNFLTELCAKSNSLLIHFSTDYVFDGQKSESYTETDKTNPINYYGKTKLLGEEIISDSDCRYLIFRISWLYSDYGKNFFKTISRLIQEKSYVNVVDDQEGVPTTADFVASHVTDLIVDSRLSEHHFNELYHLAPKGQATWFEFARNIKNYKHTSCEIKPTASEEFITKARRPLNSKLSPDKYTNTFGVDIKGWEFYYKQLINN